MKLEAKQIRQELSQGVAWPVYWIYGPERLQIRELVALLRNTVVGENAWAEEKLDGASVVAQDVIAAAQSVPFGGGLRFLVVRDAHLIREPDALAELFGARAKREDLPFVCVLLSKDLDARRKFSKQLIEKAAVVECGNIPEQQRETWIHYLAGTLGLEARALPIDALVRAEPWSLEWVESELLKWALAEEVESGLGNQVLVGAAAPGMGSEKFIDAFLVRRSLPEALQAVETLGRKPEEALPLLGLLSWNVRMLALLVARSRAVKLPPFLQDKLMRALRVWNLEELQELQSALSTLDFGIKQTPQEPMALWGVLIQQFCRN